MEWKLYKVVLRLLTPLHVGAGAVGNVQRTRPYVTGKALWGALTARLTRDDSTLGYANGKESKRYENVGGMVNGQLAFSYFYPTDEASGAVSVYPWGEAADDFAWRFLNTYGSTALDYGRNAAEEGSLHETEFIAPTTRANKPVYLVGYVFEGAGCDLKWRAALPRLQLGGERTYGWGRVGCDLEKDVTAGDGFLFGYKLVGNETRMEVPKGEPLLAHTRAHGTNAVLNAQGKIVPLVGRITTEAEAHGKDPVSAGMCWEPGAVVDADTRVKIIANGIWEKG